MKNFIFCVILGLFVAGCGVSSFPVVESGFGGVPTEVEKPKVDYTGTNAQKATQAYKNNDCDSALKYLEIACNDDEMQACYQLGHMHEKGKCVGINLAKSHEYYELACNKNYMMSCVNLGNFYKDGRGGVDKDLEKAFDLNKRACDSDIAKGCNNVGYFYWKGEGADLDRTKAREYFVRACELDPNSKRCKADDNSKEADNE